MEKGKRYALLDTDFLFKSHLAQDTSHNTLADIIITLEEYEFFCHEMILDELSRHQITPDPLPWLQGLIQKGKVHLYTDADILTELKTVYGAGASSMYTTMLEKSCNTFNQGFFSQYYGALKGLPESVSDSEFLSELAKCDGAIPSQKGLGEKKTYVLIQMMDVLHLGRVHRPVKIGAVNIKGGADLVDHGIITLGLRISFRIIRKSHRTHYLYDKSPF